MSSLILQLKLEDSQSVLQNRFKVNANKKKRFAIEVSDLFRAIAGGHKRAVVDIATSSSDPVAASATATLVSVAADETIVIGAVTLTAKASPSGENQFDQSGDDDEDAASLAAKINAHSVLSEVVSASVASNVVTITSKIKGVIGNQIALTGDTGITVSSAFLASGAGCAEDSVQSFELGIS